MALVTAFLTIGIISAEFPAPPVQAAQTAPDSGAQLAPMKSAEKLPVRPNTKDQQQFSAGRYVVVLRDEPAASYTGNVPGFAETKIDKGSAPKKQDVDAYDGYLKRQQAEVASSVGTAIKAQYTSAFSGFSTNLTKLQAARLASDPRVAQLVPNSIVPLSSVNKPTSSPRSARVATTSKSSSGGSLQGDGVVIGVIDTGIAPENPSFAGTQLGTTPSAQLPYRAGASIFYNKQDGTQFHGECATGPGFTATDCTTKIVGARFFLDGFTAGNIGSIKTGEYASPRDGQGHGSHTASTAAGAANVQAGKAKISGAAPNAKIAVYKACWAGPNPAAETDDGCATEDLLAAINAATRDNVDVINYSIGGDAATSTNTIIDQAFMAAASSGIFISAAAGNTGPDASTLDHASPWVTTVAASTTPAPTATARLGDGTSLLGTSQTIPDDGLRGPLRDGSELAKPGRSADAKLCIAGSLDPQKAKSAVVVCDRGSNARTDKSAAVKSAGGIGMLLLNRSASSLDIDSHVVPTVHLDASAYSAVHKYAASAGAVVQFVEGNPDKLPTPPTPQVASFSSRGPVTADGSDLIKPDVTAPGTTILAAVANAPGATPHWDYMSGTSMAAPHVAALAALYLEAHPDASPAETKSAMMTSASDTVDSAGRTTQNPFAQGNGEIEPEKALDPGVLYLNGTSDWNAYLTSIHEGGQGVDPVDGSDLNVPSIGIGALAGTQTVTRTLTATRAGDYTASTTGLDGVDVTVSPKTVHFDGAGAQQRISIHFTRTTAELNKFATGYLTLTPSNSQQPAVRSAVAVQPISLAATPTVSGSGANGHSAASVSFGEHSTQQVHTVGLSRGSRIAAANLGGNESESYAVDIPDGTDLLRVDLDTADDSANLDLNIYELYEGNTLVPWSGSFSSSADESLEIDSPIAGTFVIEVSTPAAGADKGSAYSLTSYTLDADRADAAFSVSPASVTGNTGDEAKVTASWSSLPAGVYLGILGYGDSGLSTSILIDAGAPVPTAGKASATITPGSASWILAGGAVRVRALKLTPGATYRVLGDGETVLRQGTPSTDGTIDWYVKTGATWTPGVHTITLSGSGITVHQKIRVSPLLLTGGDVQQRPGFTGGAMLTAVINIAGSGAVQVESRSATGTALHRETVATTKGLFDARTAEFAVPAGTVKTTATVLMPGGSAGPSLTLPTVTAREGTPSEIATDPVDGAGNVRATIENHTDGVERAQIVYTACDGSRIVASDVLPEGRTTQTWSMSGITSAVVTDRTGRTVKMITNNTSSRCASVAPARSGQNFWIHFRASDNNGEKEESGRPLKARIGFRYPALSSGYTLQAGTGDRVGGTVLTNQFVPTDRVGKAGPASYVDVTLPQNKKLFAYVVYEAGEDANNVIASDEVTTPPIASSELLPPSETLRSGKPTITGTPVAGSTLTAHAGVWRPASVRLTYQWLRDNRPVAGATRQTYQVTESDTHHKIAVAVTGITEGGKIARTVSAPVSVIQNPDPKPSASMAPFTPHADGRLAFTGSSISLVVIVAALGLCLLGFVLLKRNRHAETKKTPSTS